MSQIALEIFQNVSATNSRDHRMITADLAGSFVAPARVSSVLHTDEAFIPADVQRNYAMPDGEFHRGRIRPSAREFFANTARYPQ